MSARIDTGKTQSYARYMNNRLVMRKLRENGSCSATMLASQLNLSNAAMSAIIDDLKTKNYIKEVKKDFTPSGLGRRPIFWSINENFGCVVVVGLSNYVARVVVSDMKMNITDSMEMRVERYDVAMLYELALIVKKLMSSEKYRDIPLLRMEFSVPGRVDMATGELQLSSQFDSDIFKEKNFIVNLFERQFEVPVILDNDINLAGLGEMYCGLLKDVDDGLIVHVDEGIGGALIFGNKLYSGTRGFAGEIGLIHTQFDGKRDMLDELVSMRAIRERLCPGEACGTLDAVKMFNTDVESRRYVLKTARCLGATLKDLVEVLDIQTIVLSGNVIKFGMEYIKTLNDEVGKSINGARVYPSLLGRDASIYGAISKAVDILTDEIFK